MIRKFIDKLLGKAPAAPAKGARIPLGKRIEVAAAEHGINPELLDERAVRVVRTLQEAGHAAYIVGGAVRDLLVGRRPKDFDVATDATPEQVKSLFRRAFIIGRRFRIVHVIFGRGREHGDRTIERTSSTDSDRHKFEFDPRRGIRRLSPRNESASPAGGNPHQHGADYEARPARNRGEESAQRVEAKRHSKQDSDNGKGHDHSRGCNGCCEGDCHLALCLSERAKRRRVASQRRRERSACLGRNRPCRS